MDKVTSPDGTAIAIETIGTGPPVVLVVGAFCDRTSTQDLAGLLADSYTVHAYDRRGRGDSTDSPSYAVEREIEDLAAVIAHTGGRPALYGHSSGAILALRATASGLPVSRVAAYEPPWATADHTKRNTTVTAQVTSLVRQQRHADALEYFLSAALELPPPVIEQMKSAPFWARMQAMAPTLPYECAVTGDQRVPTQALAAITVPALLLAGGDSGSSTHDIAAIAAAAIPGATHRLVPGQGHGVDQVLLAPVLAEFLAADAAPPPS